MKGRLGWYSSRTYDGVTSAAAGFNEPRSSVCRTGLKNKKTRVGHMHCLRRELESSRRRPARGVEQRLGTELAQPRHVLLYVKHTADAQDPGE